jgi:CBS domain containing-hemolysin-like protein
MDSIPLGSLGIALAVLLVTSGFFSIAETAMMAVNRYRLRHRAHRGERGAKLAVVLLGKTDTLLGVILLGNNLINAGAATLTAVITERLLGEGNSRSRWARWPSRSLFSFSRRSRQRWSARRTPIGSRRW